MNPATEESFASQTGSAANVAAELQPYIDGSVSTTTTARATYSTDASNYRHIPLAVVTPHTAADVHQTLEYCHRHGLPVLPRGSATSIGGQATNTAVVLDFTAHLNHTLALDAQARTATVEPGLVLDDLHKTAAGHGLTFGPDPSTHNRCTLGGMIGNDACGSHSVAWGKTSDNIESLEVALADGTHLTAGPTTPSALDTLCRQGDRVGELYRSLRRIVDEYGEDIRSGMPTLERRVSGYNLEALLPENGFNLARALVGSEGTCATTLTADVDLVEAPPARALAVLGFSSSVAAADATPILLELPVMTIEGIDSALVEALSARRPGRTRPELPDGNAWLYVETGGNTASEAADVAQTVITRAKKAGATTLLATDQHTQRALWRIREEGAGLATRLADGSEAWPGWEDSAVPPEQLGDYLRDLQQLMSRHGRQGIMYGHFGEGCLHVRIDFPFARADGAQRYRDFMEETADLVVAHGGSLSGEHGDGQARAELLPRMFPPRVMAAFGAFKAAFDPNNLMNPHRIVDPEPLDANLRPLIAPATLPTRSNLALHADSGDLTSATRRCVGVGKCIADTDGVMCPSYQATRQEQHSTRGRARLLSEMLAGDVIQDGWDSPEVHEALDLCLGCKGCKTDCPVGVDMAAYKVEFLSHHYTNRKRPASHYTMGWLPRWLQLGQLTPSLVNAVTSSSLSRILKRLGGVAPERAIPKLAPRTLRRQLRNHITKYPCADSRAPSRPQVVLLPDTFTNHFDPNIGIDAAAVLEHLGYEVILPARPVCCGLTWYTTGQLDTARRILRRTLDVLEPWASRGVPIIGLEPSCTAMLKHDAFELLPDDPRLHNLASSLHTFAEHLHTQPELPTPTRTTGNVLTQVHCHQHADLGFDADRAVLSALGTDTQTVGGCCGLAGNFGFEQGHYDVSIACAENKLLPAIRATDDDTVVHADGFSCRTQIRELTDRAPTHLATLAARAWTLHDKQPARQPGSQ